MFLICIKNCLNATGLLWIPTPWWLYTARVWSAGLAVQGVLIEVTYRLFAYVDCPGNRPWSRRLSWGCTSVLSWWAFLPRWRPTWVCRSGSRVALWCLGLWTNPRASPGPRWISSFPGWGRGKGEETLIRDLLLGSCEWEIIVTLLTPDINHVLTIHWNIFKLVWILSVKGSHKIEKTMLHNPFQLYFNNALFDYLIFI